MNHRGTETQKNASVAGPRSFRAVNLVEEATESDEEKSLRLRPYEISAVRLVLQ